MSEEFSDAVPHLSQALKLKDANRPFDEIHLSLPLGKERVYRRLNAEKAAAARADIKKCIFWLRALDQHTVPWHDSQASDAEPVFNKESSYTFFAEQYNAWLVRGGQRKVDDFIKQGEPSDEISGGSGSVEKIFSPFFARPEDEPIPEAAAKWVVELVETRLIPFLAEHDRVRNQIRTEYESDEDMETELKEYLTKKFPGQKNQVDGEFMVILGNNPLAIQQSRQLRSVRRFLADSGFAHTNGGELPEVLRTIEYVQQLEALSRSKKPSDFPSGGELLDARARDKERRRELKDNQDPVQIEPLRRKLGLAKAITSAAERKVDDERRLIQGILLHLDPTQALEDKIRKMLEGLQRHFIAAEKKGDGEFTVTLDGRIDPVADKDPGIVSGDCTATTFDFGGGRKGKPLPFLEADVPIYNIKVYVDERGKKQHKGNIYIAYATETITLPDGWTVQEAKVWHIDAVQIMYNFDWKNPEVIKKILNAIYAAAQSKGVDYVVCNRTRGLRSNHRNIQEAFAQYLLNAAPIDPAILPINNLPLRDHLDPLLKKYSNLQSYLEPHGKAVLWKSDKPPHLLRPWDHAR